MSETAGLRILILDSVAIQVPGAQHPVHGKPGALLAALALDAGRTVSVERLVDGLWGDQPPASARALVHTYVWTLRRTLDSAGAPQTLSTAPGGYRLVIDPEQVDALRFIDLLASARDHPDERRLLECAADMWPGTPLAGVTEPFADPWRTRLEEAWNTVRRRRWELAIADGHADQIVPELRSATVTEPLQESVHLLLASALHETGRSDEALDVLTGVRVRLAEELGLDPSPRLDELRGRILRHEPGPTGIPFTPTNTQPQPIPESDAPAPTVPPPVHNDSPRPRIARRLTLALAASAIIGAAVIALLPPEAPTPSGPSLLIMGTDGVVTAAIALTAAPSDLQVDNRMAWVSSMRARTVTAVDLTSATLSHVVGLREAPTSIAADASSAVVALGYSGDVVRINSGGVASAPRPAFKDSQGRLVLAADETGNTWAASIDGQIAPLDGPVTATIEAQPHRLAVGGGQVWVLASSPVGLHVVDPATDAAVTSALRGEPVDLHFTGTGASIVTSGDDRLWRADPTTGRVVSTRALAGRPIATCATNEVIWVAVRDPNTLLGYDAQTLAQVSAVPLPRPPADLAVYGEQLVIVTE